MQSNETSEQLAVELIDLKLLDAHSRYRSLALLPRNRSPCIPAYSLLLVAVSSSLKLPRLKQKRHHHFHRFHHYSCYFQNLRPRSLPSSLLVATTFGKGLWLRLTASEQLIVELAGAKLLDAHYQYHVFVLLPRNFSPYIPACFLLLEAVSSSLNLPHLQQ